MSTVRVNPLPLGVYWLDVFSPSPARPEIANGEIPLADWLTMNPFAVKVTRREAFTDGALTNSPFRFFYVFQVLKPPSNFPFEKLGFPTIVKLGAPDAIPAGTTITSAETVQKSPPEDALESLQTALDSLGSAGKWVAVGLAAFLGYKVFFDGK